MQSRRSSGLTPLAIVLPHPPLPRRRSSLLSLASATSPHTPRSCHSPCLPIYNYPANRKSTDSWNSSNADDMEFDWKPDQVLLLTRTLDALPAHLVTPFNGPVPPSNLLDKIARGVAQAKGPADWPHSIRATRVKLLELARSRAKEENKALQNQHRQVIQEEDIEIDDASNYSYFHDGQERPIRAATAAAPVARRPLYRQSSMDFIKPSPTDIKDNANLARLSNRLQRTDRLFPNPAYHPYSRTAHPHSQTSQRSSSPPTDAPSLIDPSTTSSSTLDTDSFSSLLSCTAPRVLRRSASTLSTNSSSMFTDSSSGGMPLADPRLQRVRRSDSLCGPAPPPKDYPFPSIHSVAAAGLKRAPSYGALAQEARQEHVAHGHTRTHSGSYPSSDEEEKARTRRAKKMKTRTGTAAAAAVPSTPSARGETPPSSVPSSPEVLLGGGRATAPSSPVVRKSAKEMEVASPKPKSRTKTVVACRDTQKEKEEGVKSPTPKGTKRAAAGDAGKTSKPVGKDSVDVKDKVASSKPKQRPQAMNLQRNPSMFGAELPPLRSPLGSGVANMHDRLAAAAAAASPPAHPHPAASPAAKARSPVPGGRARTLSPGLALAMPPSFVLKDAHLPSAPPTQANTPQSPIASPSLALATSPTLAALTSPMSPTSLSPTSLSSPMSPTSPTTKAKTLRRVRRLAPARRISFGSLVAAPDGDPESGGGGGGGPLGRGCLGSAFQLT